MKQKDKGYSLYFLKSESTFSINKFTWYDKILRLGYVGKFARTMLERDSSNIYVLF